MFSSLWLKSTLTLLFVALIVMGSCRMMKLAGCGKREPRPPRVVTVGPLAVQDVPNGATILTSSGRKDKRTRLVTLQFIEAPSAMSEWATIAADHLCGLAGDSITVQYERRGILRDGDPDAGLPESPPAEDGSTARGPLTGIVFGASGIDLNRAMLADGYADCTADAPDYLREALRDAKKKKLGMWR